MYKKLYPLLLVLLYGIAAFYFHPESMPLMFLMATLVVAAVSMLSGLWLGILSYLIVTGIIFTLPLIETLGLGEFLTRFLGFTCTALILSLVNYRVKGYETSVAVHERKLEVISNSLSDVLITIDSKSLINFISPSVKEVFGYTPEELIGKPLITLMPDSLKEAHLKAFDKYLTTGRRTLNWKGVEVQGQRKNGEIFPIELSFGEFQDNGEKNFSAIIRDISVRKESERKAAQLAAIVESSEDAIIGKDTTGTIVSWNKGAENLFLYKPEEILGKSIKTLFPEDKFKEEDEILSKILKGEKIAHFETLRKRKDGTVFPVSLSVSPITDKNGKVVGASKIVRDITLKTKYEKSLKESDERYKSFIQNSSEGIWRAELSEPMPTDIPVAEQLDWIFNKTYLAECNQTMAEMYGYAKPSDLVHKKLSVIMPRNKTNEAYMKAFIENGYNLEEVESEETGKDGQTLHFNNSLVGIIEDGFIKRAWGVQRDTTERRNQEIELAKSKERYKAFIENSEEAIWLVEYKNPIEVSLPVETQIDRIFAEGVIAEANPKMAELYQIENPIGRYISTLSPKTKESEQFLREFIKNNYHMYDFQSSAERDGQMMYGSTSFKGIIQEGKLVRAWVVQRNTTDQKNQEQELIKSKERYKAFIDNAEEGIMRIEMKVPIDTSLALNQKIDQFFENAYIAEANQGALKILGVKDIKELLNKPFKELPAASEGDREFLKYFIENGYNAHNYESTENGTDKPTYHSTSMIGITKDGKWIRSWIIRRDITKDKEHLIERERLLKEAEDAKHGLEIASMEKDRFLANLSHELRTPLVAILGYSAMLVDGTPDEEATRTMINTIHKNAKLQVRLIEDLLDLSRIISGKITLTKENFNAVEILNDAVDTFAQQAKDKNLEITKDYENCVFYGDKKRLNQVVLNLLSNAVKFTEKGRITLSVRCSDEYMTIRVRDTGIGIDAKNFKHLFQPFKQLDSSSTRAKQGLGLGLSIVKNIVELHGGSVGVESRLGEGSEFSVYLPVIQNTEESPEEEIQNVPVTITFDGVSILLVEDDAETAGFIKYLYEQKGAKCDWAGSAKKAKELIEKGKYDIYVFDLSMPEEDGISLIKSVRGKGDKTKAVALTAFVDSYYEKMALDNGFDMFLKKPSSLNDLLSIIKLIKSY